MAEKPTVQQTPEGNTEGTDFALIILHASMKERSRTIAASNQTRDRCFLPKH